MAGRVSDRINHHVRRGSEIVKSVMGKSVVGEWAYVKELATMNTREGGEWSLLGSTLRGNVVGDGEKYDRCSSFLTSSGSCE